MHTCTYMFIFNTHMCVCLDINILNINKYIIYVICFYVYIHMYIYYTFYCTSSFYAFPGMVYLFSNVLTISLTIISFSLLCYRVTLLIKYYYLFFLYTGNLCHAVLWIFIDFCLLMILFLLLVLWLLPAIHWKKTLGDKMSSPFLYLFVTQWLGASCVLAVMLDAVPIFLFCSFPYFRFFYCCFLEIFVWVSC